MRRARWLGVLALVFIAAVLLVRGRGISVRRSALPGEAGLTRAAWRHLVPPDARRAPNPLSATSDVLRSARDHFADHCALCHANDGSGDTAVGRNTYPPAPDLRTDRTQSLTDGELFYAIEQGIPWTAMPAWGNGTAGGEQDSWSLVLFIRHLPRITAEELAAMEQMNPRSPVQEQRDRDIDDFLSGGQRIPGR